LEAVSADAALIGAHRAVTVQDVSSESGWDGPGSASYAEWCAVFGSPGDFDHAVAQDRLDRVRSDPGPGFADDTGLAIRACSVTGVDEDGEQRRRRLDRDTVIACEGIDADRPQRIRPAGRPTPAPTGWELIGFGIERLDDSSRFGWATM